MPRSELSNQGLDGCHNVEEKRAKREIANMNERRRMQNINSGFHSLRALLPQKHDGEKLSKAAILQHTSSYIYQLEQEITKLLNQNSELKRVVGGADGGAVTNTNTPDWIKRLGSQPPDCPSCKRRKYETNNKQEIDFSPLGADGSSTESSSEQEISAKQRTRMHKSSDSSSIRNQLARLERQLEEERRIRALLEEELNCQGKLSSVNGRQYQTAIDHSMPSDEVEIASESIEIEMHSCPASPPDVMSIASVATAGNEHVLSTGPVYLTNQLVGNNNNSNKMMESARHHPRVHQKQQNAIALPIDVPFVAPRDLSMDGAGLVDNCRTVKTGNPADGTNGSLVVVVDSNGVFSLIDSSKIHHQTTSKTNSLVTTTTTTNASNIQLPHQILQLIPNGGVNAKAPAINNHHQQQHHNNNNSNNKSQQNSSNESNNNNNNNNNNNSQKASSPDSAKTSRQNLNTIVEAIRHLEGEHMFNHIFNEKESKESPMTIDNNNKLQSQPQPQQTYSVSQENNNNNNKTCTSSDIKSSNSSIEIKTESNNNDNELTTATDLSKNNIDSQQRPQIIQIQQRPNVIVSNSGVES